MASFSTPTPVKPDVTIHVVPLTPNVQVPSPPPFSNGTSATDIEPTPIVPRATIHVMPLLSEEETASTTSTKVISPVQTQAVAYDYLYTMMDLYATGDQLRLVDSYTDNANDTGDTAWVYDNSLAALAFLARGTDTDLERAQLIAEALVYAQEHDPAFADGRVRDAYHANGFIQPDGTISIAAPGSSTGNMAWAVLALIGVWEQTQDPRYLEAAERLAVWIVDNTFDERGSGGYTGGVQGNGMAHLWKATEHNADISAAFTHLHVATGNLDWQERAAHAETFLQAMWNPDEGYFWTGTTEDGITINPYPIPEDGQSWTMLALEETESYVAGLEWVLTTLRQAPCVGYGAFAGLRFSNGGSNCSFEATAHTALALQLSSQHAESEALLAALRGVIAAEPQFGGGLVAAPPGGAATGYGFAYPYTAHIGATAWYLFAEQGYNPFTGEQIDRPSSTGFQHGMSYASWWQGDYQQPWAADSMQALARTGSNWIAIIVTCYQETHTSVTINCDLSRTPTDDDVIHAIRQAHELELSVMLKPHLKPIIITEIGYRSVNGTTRAPWDFTLDGEVDLQEQADAYQVALQSLCQQSWLGGIYWWFWSPRPEGGSLDIGSTP